MASASLFSLSCYQNLFISGVFLSSFFLWLAGQFFTDPCPLSALLPPFIPQPPNAHTRCPLHGLLHVSRRPWWRVF